MRAIPVLLLLTACFSHFRALSQKDAPAEDVHARLLQGKQRSVLAYAGKDHSFTLEVPVRSSKLSDVPGFVTIDKQIVQATLVPADQSADRTHATDRSRAGATNAVAAPNATATAREKELLTKYMNYELSYYKKKLKQNYSHLQTEWLTLNGRLFLVWYFDMPENYKLVSRQVYVSTLFYDQVMDLNAPVFKADDWGKARSILVRLATSMKTIDKHIDLDALEKKLKK